MGGADGRQNDTSSLCLYSTVFTLIIQIYKRLKSINNLRIHKLTTLASLGFTQLEISPNLEFWIFDSTEFKQQL